jgi:hypothetical protein
MVSTFRKSRLEKLRIRGTATAGTDTANMLALMSTVNSNPTKQYQIQVEGSVYLNAIVAITSSHLSWNFLPGAEIVRTNNLGVFQVGKDIALKPFLTPTGTLNTLAADAVQMANFSGSVARGDYIAIWSNSNLFDAPEVSPHLPYTWYVPMEVHKLGRVVDSSSPTAYLFKDYLYDSFASPGYRLLDMVKGHRWNGFRARALAGALAEHLVANPTSDGPAAFLNMVGIADLEMIGSDFACNDGHPVGGIYTMIGYDIRRANVRTGDTESPNTLNTSPYAFVDGVMNKAYLIDSSLGDCRHCYTEGGQSHSNAWANQFYSVGNRIRNAGRGYECTVSGTSTVAPTHATGGTQAVGGVTWLDLGTDGGYTIYGTTKNFKVANTDCSINARQTGVGVFTGQSNLDTHTSGLFGVFEGNRVTVPDDGSNIGISIRGRHISVLNNQIKCGSASIGMQIGGPNCIASGNEIKGGWRCEAGDTTSFNPSVSGIVYEKNRHYDMFGPGLLWTGGTNAIVANNEFTNCGYLFNTSPRIPQIAMYIRDLGPSGTIQIYGNRGRKTSEKMGIGFGATVTAAMVTRYEDNLFSGYGGTVYNTGVRHKQWRSGEAVAYLDLCWSNGKEYRANNPATTNVTAPSHSSGQVYDGGGTTGVAWEYVRDIPAALVMELEARHGSKNGLPQCLFQTKTAHTLVHADRWKPLNTVWEVLDDADAGETWSGYILADIYDENTIMVAGAGMMMIPPHTMIAGSYSITDGTKLYWDLSAGGYKATNLGHGGNPPVFRISTYQSAAGYMQGIVLPAP